MNLWFSWTLFYSRVVRMLWEVTTQVSEFKQKEKVLVHVTEKTAEVIHKI